MLENILELTLLQQCHNYTLRYDTSIFTCSKKLDEVASLILRTTQTKNKENKYKNRVAQKKRSGQ